MVHYITFPGLFDDILTVPTETIFGIRLYAVMIMTGFLIAALYAMKRSREFGSNPDIVADILIFALPISIIGARIYYVVNMWDYYSQNPKEIIAVWNGGLAIYGAVIAAAIVVIVYGKIKKMDILSFMDLGAISLLIGQFIGRWGNFFNAEAYGTATDLPWGMVIRTSVATTGTAVHPTFLYESLWNFIGFIILHFYSKKRKFKGEIFLMYVAWYGLGRGFIEGLRTDSLMLGNTDIRISQVLAFVSCAVAVLTLIYLYVTKKGIPVTVGAPLAAEGETVSEEENPSENTAEAQIVENISEGEINQEEENEPEQSEISGDDGIDENTDQQDERKE